MSETNRPVPGFDAATGAHERVAARDLIWWLLESPVFLPPVTGTSDPLQWPGYDSAQRTAKSDAGTEESVVPARGRVPGTRGEVVLIVWEFAFLGGSMGVIAGETIARAYEYAIKERLPVVLFTSTGGARMQEGMASLVQMAKTSEVARKHADAGLLQAAILSDPTTGGVFASHANLTDVIAVEHGATVGFAGPRVAEALTGGPLPEGSHTAEGAVAHGLADGVLRRDQVPAFLARVASWVAPPIPEAAPAPEGDRTPLGDAWTEVERSRSGTRPHANDYLTAFGALLELRGDRAGYDDPAIRVALCRPAGRSCVVIALDRDGNGARVTAEGYRKAWRGIRLASRLNLPLITLIDTPGADASADAEMGGIAHHIAQTFVEMLGVVSPTIAVVTGEGGSGGALALAVADRLLLLEHATFSVIAPEGAAAILHRDAGRAAEVAALLDPTAPRLVALGIADEVIPEPVGQQTAAVLAAVVRTLDTLAGEDWNSRREVRSRRWRKAGGP